MIIDTERLKSDPDYKDGLRHSCETDHFFLAKVVGWNDFIPHLHQPVKDLYFPKNRNLPIGEQHHIKYRMHLDPRFTYKTTMGKVDTLQWILAFPELITIVNASSTLPLAEAISAQLAGFLWQPGWKAPTVLQLLYPELLDVGRAMPEGKWNTPNHNALEMDSTLDFTSPQKVQAGWHPWVLNPDDMAETTNSGKDATDVSRNRVINSFSTNKNTLNPQGYLNIRGTRYHPFELYGYQLDKMNPEEWKILIRGSLSVKSGQRLMPGEFPGEDQVILLFPEILSYSKLRSLFFEHYESFMCQQMNDPQGGNIPVFDEPLFNSSLCAPDRIPLLGDTFICWRLPYGGKPFMSEHAEGAAARVFGGKVYIIDTWRGVYTPSRLAQKIVQECRKHQTGKVMLEAVPGSSYIEADLRNESFRKNHPIRIQWVEYEEDDNVRATRMRQVEPLMRSGRLMLSTSTTKQQESRSQFLHFGLIPANGIVDCISRLASKIPATIMRDEIEEEEIELQRRRREDQMAQMAWGQAAEDIQAGMIEASRREQIRAEASNYAWERANSLGLPPLPGGLDG